MKKTYLGIFSLLILSICFQYCANDKYPVTYSEVGICFESEILPIFVSNCAISGCHDPINKTKGYDLSNYDGILEGIDPFNPHNSIIYETITSTNDQIMPPAPSNPLNIEEINLIKDWINKGAPETADCFDVNCPTSSTFAAVVTPILDNWCNGCHATNVAASAGGGIALDTYSDVKLKVDDGSLIGAIKQEQGFVAMPLNSPPIPTCDIQSIELWISEGALDN